MKPHAIHELIRTAPKRKQPATEYELDTMRQVRADPGWSDFGADHRRNEEAHQRLMAILDAMTPAEVFQTSVDAGIHNPDGTLTPQYGGKAKR